ncbi:MAG: serine/threonine-protein kinase [Gammaproteobacteria bacterium]|nr:serine/threonine-protein kinase [Gammaproteobacteria bacterium]
METPIQDPIQEPSPRTGEEPLPPEPPPQSGAEQSGAEASASEPFPKLPAQLGKYDLISVLGQGSFGTVYQASDQLTGRKVAVKVLHHNTAQPSESAEDRDERRKSFFNEAHAAVMMRHPNILQVLDAGVEKDHCYIVTELVENAHTLQKYTSAEQLLPVLQVVKIIYKCAAALDHIHGREVIHRDIKPENILVFPTGEVKIGDFGVAHVLHGAGEMAPEEEILGSPQYMAPEQLSGGKISYRTDFYSLGVIAYELLTGQHPFPAKNLQELCRKHQQAPPALTRYRLDLPPILQLVIDRTLNQDPEQRYGTGEELAQDLSKTFKNLGEFNVGPKLEELLDSLQQIQFFSEFTPPEIKEVTEICICEEYKPGEAVICEGTINDSFYLVINGNVKISKEGVDIDRLDTGGCFGEMGYLTGIKRTATVSAGDHSHLVKINANLAAKLSPAVQLKFSRAFIRVLVNRLAQTTGLLISK